MDTSEERLLPDYLPARMVNEFVYCPRLFFYEFVEGLFRDSVDTIEGQAQHAKVDAKPSKLPDPAEAADGETIHSRSVTLASERCRVIAKMDLVESAGGLVTPVDYKHGKPRDGKDGLELWPTDRVQLAIQGLVLREAGYVCEEGVAYYAKTRQRVRVRFDTAVMVETERLIAEAWEVARVGIMPSPLVDSPKCPACSMVGICLPDETNSLIAIQLAGPVLEQMLLFGEPVRERPAVLALVRRLVTPRSERKPVYLNTQGTRWGNRARCYRFARKTT